MLIMPTPFLYVPAAGATWDVTDNFTSYATSTILESTGGYTDANGNSFAGDFRVQANDTVEISGADNTARLLIRTDTALSSVDQRSEIDVVSGAGSGRCHVSAIARSTAAGIAYELLHDTVNSTRLTIRKWTAANTFSDIHNFTVSALSAPFSLAIEVTTNGANADIEAFLDTGSGWVSQGTYTDSSSPLTAGDYGGFGMFNIAPSSTADNLLAVAEFRTRAL